MKKDPVARLLEVRKQHDPVAAPSHYRHGTIECLDYILDQNFNYLAGNVVKYVTRYRYKGSPLQDLEKAAFYLEKLIAFYQEVQAGSSSSQGASKSSTR